MILVSPNPKQKTVTVNGYVFKRTPMGFFEIPNDTALCQPLLDQGFVSFVPTPQQQAALMRKDVKSIEFYGTVTRCGCGEDEEAREAHRAAGVPCPNAIGTEELGLIGYWHRNPLKRLAYQLGKFFRKHFNRNRHQAQNSAPLAR